MESFRYSLHRGLVLGSAHSANDVRNSVRCSEFRVHVQNSEVTPLYTHPRAFWLPLDKVRSTGLSR